MVVPTDFTLFELGVAVEVFAEPRPEDGSDWYDVRVCTAHPGEAAAVNGLFEARIRHGVEAIDDAETIIVVDAEENLHRPAEPEVIGAIRRAYRRGARLVSFCTGAFVLAAAGVLDGRPATTHWEFAELLARSYPRIRVDPDVLYVDDGQVLTSAGTAAGIDLSLHIIRKDHGAHVARTVARSMVVAPHREGGQAQFVMTPVPNFTPEQEGVSRAMQYAMENLHEDLGLTLLASRAYMSPRNFSRRFRDVTGTTPVKWLNHQRLTRVRELLEQTDLSVERIAAETGFNSAVTLRQRFAQHLLTSPTAYRRAFRAGGAEAATPSSVGAPAA